jgi:hypothetical protein
MEPNKKVKVSVIIKYVSDKQSDTTAKKDSDGYLALNQIMKLLGGVSTKNDDEDKEKILHLLDASKLSNEIMASALIDTNCEDLFDEKVETIKSIDEIINKIKNL